MTTTATATTFIPRAGRRACYRDPETDVYEDVTITKVYNRGRLANIKLDDKSRLTIETALLESPLDADVNERFQYFEELSELVLTKKLGAMFVSGEGGIGKTHMIDQVLGLLELEEDVDFVRIKGHCTPRALYDELKEWSDRLVIFDDCDSVLKDSTSGNILKAVLDTHGVRRVKWLSSKNAASESSFQFTGSVVFLSNMSKEVVESAILSRSIIVDLSMTTDEKIERMQYILPTLHDVGQTLNVEERQVVMDCIAKYKNTVESLNLRTLIKGLKVYENTKNYNLLRHQILNS